MVKYVEMTCIKYQVHRRIHNDRGKLEKEYESIFREDSNGQSV